MSTSGASKSNNDGVYEVNDTLQNTSTAGVSVCANCGKEGDDINNICNKCKQVKYCNAACKKKHRHKHKKDCEEHLRVTAEQADEKHEEKLFKEPPPAEDDCPICFLRVPSLTTGWRYMLCCGKTICCGCDYAPVYDDQGNKGDIIKQNECPFCRTVAPISDKEMNSMLNKRIEANDAEAIHRTGIYYRDGSYGFPQDYTKALEYWHRAGELGSFESFLNIGYAYNHGEGVEIDKKKANHYYEIAAMKGDETARHNLAAMEGRAGNMDQALKHFKIAVGGGYSKSLNNIKDMYLQGDATKEDYTKALRLYQSYLSEIKSPQRDEAAAFSEKYRYY